jgi:hypothetical protein
VLELGASSAQCIPSHVRLKVRDASLFLVLGLGEYIRHHPIYLSVTPSEGSAPFKSKGWMAASNFETVDDSIADLISHHGASNIVAEHLRLPASNKKHSFQSPDPGMKP